ncbi:hypothetical protein YIM73518_15740 [Thermus brockianus]
MRSMGASRRPQEGHREGGKTMDSPLGRRWMTTLRKEPTTRPKTRARRGHMGAFYGMGDLGSGEDTGDGGLLRKAFIRPV